ncbi:MAG: hypothetical protein Q8N17_26045 [Burkholderiaceae bacterium]|nr:hypothetical protein [Burkholderiaceae bacterium]
MFTWGPQESGSFDPLWANVSLLLKFDDQADESTTITDSSSHADHKTATTGIDIDTGRSKFGAGSLRIVRQQPEGIIWSGTRFNRTTGNAITVEGWSRKETALASTATPMIFRLAGLTIADQVMQLTKYQTGNKVQVRFGVGDTATEHTYTPDGDGWFYWMMKIDAANVGELWLGTTLAKTFSGAPGSTGVANFALGGISAGAATAIDFNVDNLRVTQADRYPSGITSIPTDFPIGGS